MVTAERLHELLHYDHITGLFTCKVSRGTLKAGSAAGSTRPDRGYLILSIDGMRYYGHRLAWLYVHNEWPAAGIDHIDGNTRDNRIENLRPATQAQNNANSRKRADNTSGFKGVSRYYNKWSAYIHQRGRRIYLGAFATPEEAHAVYCRAAAELFGEFARVA